MKSGVIVKKNDPDELSIAIEKLADNPVLRKKLGENASQKSK